MRGFIGATALSRICDVSCPPPSSPPLRTIHADVLRDSSGSLAMLAAMRHASLACEQIGGDVARRNSKGPPTRRPRNVWMLLEIYCGLRRRRTSQ